MIYKGNYRKKKIILYGGMLLLIYLAWLFSFKPALTAIQLNHSFKEDQSVDEVAQSAFPVLTKKYNFYKTLVKSYKTNSQDSENRLWQSLSGIAINNGLEISFEPALISEKDTVLSDLHIVKQNFNFKGNYFQMVKLLDSVNKTAGIGRASGFLLTDYKKQGVESSGKLSLKLEIAAITR